MLTIGGQRSRRSNERPRSLSGRERRYITGREGRCAACPPQRTGVRIVARLVRQTLPELSRTLAVSLRDTRHCCQIIKSWLARGGAFELPRAVYRFAGHRLAYYAAKQSVRVYSIARVNTTLHIPALTRHIARLRSRYRRRSVPTSDQNSLSRTPD